MSISTKSESEHYQFVFATGETALSLKNNGLVNLGGSIEWKIFRKYLNKISQFSFPTRFKGYEDAAKRLNENLGELKKSISSKNHESALDRTRKIFNDLKLTYPQL